MGKKTSTTTSQVQIPPEVMARYNAVNTRAEEVASKPFQKYGTEASDFVAQINDQQRAGINNVNAAAGSYQPYIDAATGATVAGMDQANAGELDISKYMSPYIQNVADTTGAMLSQENARAQSGNLGTAISSGAFGGDRAGIAAANLSQQQNLAYGKTMADIYNQGYTQAVGTAQQQQGVNLGAEQANLARLTAGGAQLAGLGTTAQQAGLAGAEAQINAGTLEQQTEQAGKTALVNQFMQEQGYPFQVAQFLANIATGTGALSGSTTATTQPAPFFSDRRLKHDVKRIGKTDDGLPIYSFKYNGDEKEQTHVGFMADEVEKVKPEAVGVHPTGYKTVDYEKATDKNSMGGGVAPQRAGEAFAAGGVAGPYDAPVGSQPGAGIGGYVPQAYLPVGELMVADPAHATNAQRSTAQQLAALASLGESAKDIKGTWDWAKDGFKSEAVGEGEAASGVSANAYGGAVGAQYLKPQQGGLAPNTEKSYLTDTLASQDKSDKPKLDAAPGAGGGGSSPAGDIAALAKVGLAIAGIPMPFRNGGAAGYYRGGAPDVEIIRGPGARATEEDIIRGSRMVAAPEDRNMLQAAVDRSSGRLPVDLGSDVGSAIRSLGRDAVGYAPGMVDPGLAAGVGMIGRPTGEFPPSRYPDFPSQDDLDQRNRESSSRPNVYPNEPTSRNRYTPLAMDYGRPLNETQLGATNTLVPRQYMFDGPQTTFVSQPYVPVNYQATGVAPASRYPELPTQEDLDRRYRESSARPDTFPNEPTSMNRYTPLAMDYGRPLYETQFAATNTLTPRQYMFDGPRSGVAASDPGVNQNVQTGAVPAGGVAPPRPTVGPAQDLSFRLPAAPTGALAQPVGGLTMPTGRAAEAVTPPQPPTGGLAPARPTAPAGKPTAYTGVAGAGAGYTDVILPDGTVQRREGTRNWRNNNPGNIEFGPFAEANGAIGSDGRFAVFPTYEAGRAAKEALLFSSEGYAGKTIASAISRYAPASDSNDTAGYIAKVASEIGVEPNTPLSELSPSQRNTMLTAMERIEGGGAGGDGQFASYSTGAAPGQGLGVSTKGQGEPQKGGLGRAILTTDKPYEDRTTLGKMFYNEKDGSLNKNALLSLASGIGGMLSSPSQFFLPSLGLGLQGFAGTYAGLEKQAADVGLTKAETERTNVATQTSRFFTIGPGGIPLVALDGGGTATLDEFLSSPELKASGNPVLEAQIREEAARRAGTSASGSGTLYDTPLVQGYIDGEAETASMDLTGSRETSNLKYAAAESAAEAARATRATTLLQADAVANLVSGDETLSTGAFGELKLQAIRYANELLRMGGYPEITGATDAQIIQKVGALAALERASGGGQQSFEALSAILSTNPNMAFEPEANAKLMATLMLAQQRAVDMAGFMREYRLADGNTYNLVNEAGKAFDDVYGRRNLAEEQALTTLVLNAAKAPEGSDESPMKFLMDPGVSSAEKNIMIREILSASGMSESMIRAMEDANGQIDMARYFGG